MDGAQLVGGLKRLASAAGGVGGGCGVRGHSGAVGYSSGGGKVRAASGATGCVRGYAWPATGVCARARCEEESMVR